MFLPRQSDDFKTNLVDPACKYASERLTQKANQFGSIINVTEQQPGKWTRLRQTHHFCFKLLIVLCKRYPIIPRVKLKPIYTLQSNMIFSGPPQPYLRADSQQCLPHRQFPTSLKLKGCYNNMMHLFPYSFPLLISHHPFLKYQLP